MKRTNGNLSRKTSRSAETKKKKEDRSLPMVVGPRYSALQGSKPEGTPRGLCWVE